LDSNAFNRLINSALVNRAKSFIDTIVASGKSDSRKNRREGARHRALQFTHELG
jgi:hypothetical protein